MDSIATFEFKLKAFLFARAFDVSDQNVNEGYRLQCVIPWVVCVCVCVRSLYLAEGPVNFSFERMGSPMWLKEIRDYCYHYFLLFSSFLFLQRWGWCNTGAYLQTLPYFVDTYRTESVCSLWIRWQVTFLELFFFNNLNWDIKNFHSFLKICPFLKI